MICPHPCKNDSARVCLEPALALGAAVLDQTRVIRLETQGSRVSRVICRRSSAKDGSVGEDFVLQADMIVLAAGALETPCILLRSTSTDHPRGLANASGVVGRNLMRHYVDLFPVFLRGEPGEPGLGDGRKELAFNDLYWDNGIKLGTVQSFGVLPPAPIIVAALEHELRHKLGKWVSPLLPLVRPVIRGFLRRKFERAHIMVSIVEDLPFAENRVEPADELGEVNLHYRVQSIERHRIKLLRQRMGKLLKPMSFMAMKQAENNDRIAHVCGTCRAGDDSRESALNRDNRAHDVDNLWVVDSSYFPSSAGINPGLTIAANALRVANAINS